MSVQSAPSQRAAPSEPASLTARPASRLSEATDDLARGLSRSWIWSRLAYQDMRERYRGSALGPFWVTLTNLIMIAAMGTIYSRVFSSSFAIYVPYITVGLLTWQFISGIMNESCNTFISAQDVIQQVPMPFSVQAYRVVYRNLIVLAHNIVLVPLALVIFGVHVDWRIVEVIPALALLSFNAFWLCLFVGAVSTRFRDVPQIVTNVIQVLFFVTPIFWPIDATRDMKPLVALNPLFAWIDVVRAPLLGASPEMTSWPILLLSSAIIAGCSFAFFVRFRERIAYWT